MCGAAAVPPEPGAAGWRPSSAFAAVAVASAGGFAIRLIVEEGGDPRIWVALALIVFNLVMVAVPLVFAGFHGRPSASDFGLRQPPLARGVGLTIAVLIFVYALSAAWAVALGLDDAENVVDRLAVGDGTLNAFLVVVLLAVATPLAEEFLFRGFFFRAMRNRLGVWPAVLLTTVVFTATHVGWTPVGVLVPAAVFGLGLTLLYVWTGSLYPSLAMHALLNALAAVEVLEGWQVPVALVGSVAATLAIARLIGAGLGEQAPVRR